MQAVGWLPISPIYGFVPPYWAGLWFGIYPTWQGVVSQIAASVFVIGSYYLAEGEKKRQLIAKSRAHTQDIMPQGEST